METAYVNFSRVLLHASASITVERRHMRAPRAWISVKCNPVGISSNISITYLLASPLSSNFPPSLLGAVSQRKAPVLIKVRTPDSDKSCKFGNFAMTSWTRERVIPFALRVKEVMDCGKLQNGGIHND